MSSDWITEFNCQYQQPGYEFLKTIFPYSNDLIDRNLFKKITIKAMDNNCNLGSEIQQVYMEKNPSDWKDDLHIITTKLCSLINSFNDHRNEINIAIERMKKYKSRFSVVNTEKSKFKVIERSDDLSISGFRKK